MQAFCRWNRDPGSPSRGSFDRKYWGWKYKDFSDATLQYAIKPAIEYCQMEGATEIIPALLSDYVFFLKQIQMPDGSFNQCYPYERTPGVIYDILTALIFVRRSSFLTLRQDQQALDGIIYRAVDYALRTDEKHGEIANHIASYAYALFYYYEYSRDERARHKGEDYLARLFALMDKSEGWFQEYLGPDPGYQTRTMRYLAKCAILLNKTDIWDALKKSADFIDAILMPDGSIHPMLGTRSTALLYPSAFELLASYFDTYQGLADRVRFAWHRGLVPLPSCLDFDNAIRLAADAKDAADIVLEKNFRTQHPSHSPAVSRLGGHDLAPVATVENQAWIDFPHAGIIIVRHSRYLMYLGYRLGGVVIIYGRRSGTWELLYEDSGYLLRLLPGEKAWVTRQPDSGRLLQVSPERLLVQASFFKSLHEELIPWRFILLRILNLTVLRSQWLGDLFRKVVVRRLMLSRQKLPLTLRREIFLSENEINIKDQISTKAGEVSSKPGQLFRCRRVTGMHMASARYFQAQELKALSLAWIQQVNWSEPGKANHEVTIKIE